MGEHKGYGLALAHEVLTAILTGGKWTRDIKSLYEEDKTGIQGTCHSFMALDPDCFIGKENFKKSMDSYIRSIKESGKAENKAEILMPGEPEYQTESERLKQGIPLSPSTVKELIDLGESFGLSLPLMD
jgi:LDH2 family malate/lactate/ureidoglycolate dehydrogenase